MKEYITVKSIPNISFAHIYNSGNYKNFLSAKTNFFEIGYLSAGKISFNKNGSERMLTQGSSYFFARKNSAKVFGSEVFEIHSIGIECDYKYLTDEFATISPTETNHDLTSAIDELIVMFNAERDKSQKIISKIFALVDLFNTAFGDNLGNADFGGEITYVNKAKIYIKDNFNKKITLNEVSKELHISPAYLCVLFKKHTGKTLINYVNEYKLGALKNFIINEGLSMKEACAKVGIKDPAYCSRLFKKYEKKNLREYKISILNDLHKV